MILAFLLATAAADTPEAVTTPAPEYPMEALSLGLPPTTCTADVPVDTTGAPGEPQWTGCPEVFQAAARAALAEWRWHPPAAPTMVAATLTFDAADRNNLPGFSVRPIRQKMPKYPREAFATHPDPTPCKVRLFLNEKGRPYDLAWVACPAVFQPSARRALLRWRFVPPEVDGVPVRSQILIKVVYKIED